MTKRPRPSAVFDSYWRFAFLRQEIFHQRARAVPPPWTDDEILNEFRFTNAYRSADRVSQFLIRYVAYTGKQDRREVFFRVLLFKLFNRVSTWTLLEDAFGELRAASFDVDAYDRVMGEAFNRGERLYSAAYIMPAADRASARKHTTHLQLVHRMLADHLPERLGECGSMQEAYSMLRAYGGIGDFLAYQLVTDLNYTVVLDFSEMDFVQAGPGARSGLEKCFLDDDGLSAEDLIRWTCDRQEAEFASRRLKFQDLWGRRLQLIDCQNLFCEVDKYARVAHPGVASRAGRNRIKQRFRPDYSPLEIWFPPKWGINTRLRALVDQGDAASFQIGRHGASTAVSDAAEELVARQDRPFPLVELSS